MYTYKRTRRRKQAGHSRLHVFAVQAAVWETNMQTCCDEWTLDVNWHCLRDVFGHTPTLW